MTRCPTSIRECTRSVPRGVDLQLRDASSLASASWWRICSTFLK